MKRVALFFLRLGVWCWYRLGLQRPTSWVYRILCEPHRNTPVGAYKSLSNVFLFTSRFKWAADAHGVAIGSAGQFQWNGDHGVYADGDCDEFAAYTLAAIQASPLGILDAGMVVTHWWDSKGISGHYVVAVVYDYANGARKAWLDYGPTVHFIPDDNPKTIGAAVRAYYGEGEVLGITTAVLDQDLKTLAVVWG